MSGYRFRVLAPSVFSHLRMTIDASEPAYRERFRKWKMFTLLLIQLVSSACNSGTRSRKSMEWFIYSGLNLRTLVQVRQVISSASPTLSLLSGSRVFHISGTSLMEDTFVRQQSTVIFSSHISSGVVDLFAGTGTASCWGGA